MFAELIVLLDNKKLSLHFSRSSRRFACGSFVAQSICRRLTGKFSNVVWIAEIKMGDIVSITNNACVNSQEQKLQLKIQWENSTRWIFEIFAFQPTISYTRSFPLHLLTTSACLLVGACSRLQSNLQLLFLTFKSSLKGRETQVCLMLKSQPSKMFWKSNFRVYICSLTVKNVYVTSFNFILMSYRWFDKTSCLGNGTWRKKDNQSWKLLPGDLTRRFFFIFLPASKGATVSWQ